MKNLKQILLDNNVKPCNITKVLNINSTSYSIHNIMIEKNIDEIIDLLIWNACTDVPIHILTKDENTIKGYIGNKNRKKAMIEEQNNSNKSMETIQALRENKTISQLTNNQEKLLQIIADQQQTINKLTKLIENNQQIITVLVNK